MMASVSKTPRRPTGPDRPSAPRPPETGVKDGRRNPDVERALALRDVMDHAVKMQREITAPSDRHRGRTRIVWATVVCVPLLALAVYSWVAHPEFIWGPRPTAF